MAASKSVGEEVINHYGATRLRVTGSAALKLTLYSLDQVKVHVMKDLNIQPFNNIEPTRLSNFTQQKAQQEIRTTEIDEVFKISKIVIFVKPVAKSYPM